MSELLLRECLKEITNKNIFIEAGAGAGKSTIMIQRLIYQALKGNQSFHKTAAITFTNKAAVELEEKLMDELSNIENQQEKERLIEEKEQLTIGTIHAFCHNILEERPIEAGLAPGFEVIENDRKEEILSRLLSQVVHEMRKNQHESIAVIDQESSIFDFKNLLNTRANYQELGIQEVLPKEVNEEELERTGKNLLNQMKKENDALSNALYRDVKNEKVDLKAFKEKTDENLYFTELLTEKGKMEYEKLDADHLNDKLTYFNNRTSPRMGKNNSTAEVKEEGERIYKKYRYLKEVYNIENAKLHYHVNIVFTEVLQRYQQEKKMLNVVTNNDLLRKTFELLQHEEARQYFHEKYQYLYVDELQDTDPLQTKILYYLTSVHAPKDMEDTRPKPGSLFLVGDPKQSIYRFRNADLRIYQQIKDEATSNTADWVIEQLNINFRSTPHLINWYNTTFLDYFQDEKTLSIQPNYEYMSAYREEGSTEQLPVYKIPSKDDAKQIASWIAEEYRKKEEGVQSAIHHYDDVMIIMPTTVGMIRYINALKEKGIPTSFSGRVAMSDFKEIIRLTHLIDYFVSPDKFKKSRLLAQNWNISFSVMNEIEMIRNDDALDDKEKEVLMSSQEAYLSYQTAEEVLQYYMDLSKVLPPMELLSGLIYKQQFGIFDHALTNIQYESSLSILTTYLEKVRESNCPTLSDLSTEMNHLLTGTMEYEMLVNPNEKAVQIMNLHKTKGLQAKVVFLAKPSGKGQHKEVSIVHRNKWHEEVEYALFKNTGYFNTVIAHTESFLDKMKEEEKHKEAERRRLLYVAATRAKNMLIISEGENRRSITWEDLLSDGLPELVIPEVIQNDESLFYIQIPRVQTRQALENGEKEIFDHLKSKKSYSKRSPSNSRIFTIQANARKLEDPNESLEQLLLNNHQYEGPLWGNIIHAAYEYLLLNPDELVTDAILNEIITRGLEQYELADQELAVFGKDEFEGKNRHNRLLKLLENQALKKEIKNHLFTFEKNEQLKKWKEKYKIHPEVSFSVWSDNQKESIMEQFDEEYAKENKATWITGVIDLVLESREDANELVLVDYKTDQMNEGESINEFHIRLSHQYAQQLRAYQIILQEKFRKKIKEVYLYVVRTDTFIPISYEVKGKQNSRNNHKMKKSSLGGERKSFNTAYYYMLTYMEEKYEPSNHFQQFLSRYKKGGYICTTSELQGPFSMNVRQSVYHEPFKKMGDLNFFLEEFVANISSSEELIECVKQSERFTDPFKAYIERFR